MPDLPRPIRDKDQVATCLHVAAQVIRQLGGPTDAKVEAHQKCALCGTESVVGSLPATEVLDTGSHRYCLTCCYEARGGLVDDVREGDEVADGVLAALRELAILFGGPPSRSQLEAPVPPQHGDDPAKEMDSRDRARDRLMLLRMAVPMRDLGGSTWGVANVPARRTWTEWPQSAALIDDGWRPSFGTYSTATDGHLCRSMMERHVDDFFHAHGIEHDVEPPYPYHPELNVTGVRADWRLPGGTFVEAAGLTSRPEYRDKLSQKQNLAAALGVDLMVVTEADLSRLPDVFARWLHSARPAPAAHDLR